MIRATALALFVIMFAMPATAAEVLLVANKSGHTVDVIALENGRSIATLPTGHAPHEIAVSPDGRLAVIANYGDRAKPGSSLTIIDVPRRKVVSTIDLGRHSRPHGVAFIDAKRVAVTTEGSRHLLVVDVGAAKIEKEIETAQEISHMVALTGGRAFVANIGSGSLTAIDLETGRKLQDIATGDGAEGIAVRPGGREVWVTNRAADTISIVDPQSLEIVATIPVAGFPIRLAFTPDGSQALVSAARSGEVVRIDAAARKEVKRRKLDFSLAPDAARRLFGDQFGASPVPVGLVVARDGRRAWIAATQSDVVAVIDPQTLDVVDLVRAGREPDGMALAGW